MGISTNNLPFGFRKWADAHAPKMAPADAIVGDVVVISAPDPAQSMTAPDEQPHRPWLVPGKGTL
jgi:hypothetical protein